MKVLIINEVCGIGSHGKICADIAKDYLKENNEVKVAYGRDVYVPNDCKDFAVRIGTDFGVKLHGVYTRIFDRHGFGSRIATSKFLKWAEEYNPDLLWLHNIHGYYINVEMLFRWIKSRTNMRVKWTLHDCWAFTGHCAYFSMARCEKWKTECSNCPNKSMYPKSLVFDNSKSNYERKKLAFTGVKDMTLIVPSNWLANLVKQSFLCEYPVEVVYNKINKEIFKPTECDFREKYDLKDKKIVLGVASVWEERKGLDDFVKLSDMLSDDYKIVLVGLTKEQAAELPSCILAIERTNGQKELAGIYSTADIYVNPSKEETFGMTTIEALSCGTQAVVYKDTACEEIANEYGAIAVPYADVDALYEAIIKNI